MPFDIHGFISAINDIEDEPPQTAWDFASAWSDAFVAGYGKPIPSSTTTNTAGKALKGIFLGAYKNRAGAGKEIMNAGVSAYAAILAVGMLPAFAAVPPMMYLGFTQTNVLGQTTINGLLGPAMAAVTMPWFMTGIAVNTSSGVTIPWV